MYCFVCVDTRATTCPDSLSWLVRRYQNMQKLATLTGHTLRVLYLACSPDGQTIVTGAGDETLRFWNVFPGPKAQSGGEAGVGSMMRTVIR